MASTDTCPASADSPFDDLTSTNVVLRTSDGVDFYVHKHILSMASPFFEGMFSIDQPSSMPDGQHPVIDVSEKSEVIEGVLRLCYPVDEPDMSTVTKTVDILGAAHKYDMKSVKRRLQIPLKQLIASFPLQVYAHACFYRLEDSAKDAAVAWRQRAGSAGVTVGVSTTPWNQTSPGESYVQEMAEVPSGMFFRLLSYVRKGVAPATYCDHTQSGGATTTPSQSLPDFCVSHYRRLGIEPDMTVHAIDGTTFPVHQLVLSIASRVLGDLVMKEGSDGVLYLTENSQTLSVVLRACHPGTDISSMELSVSLAASVLGAARKYVLPELEAAAKRKLEGYIRSQALEVYFHAATLGWKEGARASAVQLSRLPIADLYTSLMESAPAKYYYALLKFHYDYRKALLEGFQNGNYAAYLEQGFGDVLRRDWLWQDTGEIFPELFLATAIELSKAIPLNTCNYYSGSYHYGNGGQTSGQPPSQTLDRFQTVKTTLLAALSKVQLDISWGNGSGTETVSESES